MSVWGDENDPTSVISWTILLSLSLRLERELDTKKSKGRITIFISQEKRKEKKE